MSHEQIYNLFNTESLSANLSIRHQTLNGPTLMYNEKVICVSHDLALLQSYILFKPPKTSVGIPFLCITLTKDQR